MKIKEKLLILFLLIYSFTNTAAASGHYAVRGVLDLRETAGNDFLMSLDGEWEFYWSRMLGPQDFLGGLSPEPDLYGKVPSYWTDYTSEIDRRNI